MPVALVQCRIPFRSPCQGEISIWRVPRREHLGCSLKPFHGLKTLPNPHFTDAALLIRNLRNLSEPVLALPADPTPQTPATASNLLPNDRTRSVEHRDQARAKQTKGEQ